MWGEILEFSGRYIDEVNIRVGESRIHTARTDGLVVVAPRHHAPGVTRLLFIRQLMNSAGSPVEQSNVILRALLGLIGKGNRAAIVRPVRILLENRRRVGQVDRLPAIARHAE